MAFNVWVVHDSAAMRSIIIKTLRLSGMPLGEIYQVGAYRPVPCIAAGGLRRTRQRCVRQRAAVDGWARIIKWC